MSTATAPTATEVPDPYRDPTGYLVAKGWVPVHGNDPRSPRSLWLDPTKPKEDKEEMVTVMTRKLPTGQEQHIKQMRVTPAGWPELRDSAVAIQMSRDQKPLPAKK